MHGPYAVIINSYYKIMNKVVAPVEKRVRSITSKKRYTRIAFGVIVCALAFILIHPGTTTAWIMKSLVLVTNTGSVASPDVNFGSIKLEQGAASLVTIDNELIDKLLGNHFDNPFDEDHWLAAICYPFTMNSDIPVYFKVKWDLTGYNDVINQAVVYWSEDSNEWIPMRAAPGNYYYIPEPFPSGKYEEINLLFLVDFSEYDEDANDMSSFPAPGFAEIIQATNNAVFQHEEWKEFAHEFIPYIMSN